MDKRGESHQEPENHAEKQQRLLPWCIISSLPRGGLDGTHHSQKNITNIKHSFLSPGKALSFSRQEHLLCHALSFSLSASTLLILSFRKQHLLTHSLSTPPVSVLPPFCPPSSPSHSSPPPPAQAERRQDNMQQVRSVLCEDLAQPFVSFSIHVMRLKQRGELHSTAKRKEQYHHA